VISFRHHIATLVAVFLALAVGVVLGGGPLSGATGEDDTAPTSAPAEEQQADPRVAYGDGFAGAVAPVLLSGKLAERSVAVVTVPGADEQVVTALAEQVAAAGGNVTARYALTGAMVDPAQKSLVDTLGSQLMTQQPDGSVAADATTYDRIGQLLGIAASTGTPEGDQVGGKAQAIAEGLVGAELMDSPGEVGKRAPLVLLVLGDEPSPEGGDTILSGLVAGLSRAAAGVVVAGTTADGGTGQLGRLRGEPVAAEVATVDGIDTAGGRVATILALARALGAKGGAFGASGSDGPVPLG
jgi:hypothetical protein